MKCGHHANDAEGNKSLNTEQLASITINDCDNSLLPNITLASCDAELIGNKGQNMQTIDNLHAVNSSSNDESVQVTAVGYDNREFKIYNAASSTTRLNFISTMRAGQFYTVIDV